MKAHAPRASRCILALALALGAPGCGGCDEAPAEAPSPAPTAKAKAVADGGVEEPAVGEGEAPPAVHPLASGWSRAPAAEPHPAARGLYRRALERVRDGDPAGAARLFEQIRGDHGDTRFARRIRGGGDPAATAALLGLGATVGAAVFVGAIEGLEARGSKAPGGSGP